MCKPELLKELALFIGSKTSHLISCMLDKKAMVGLSVKVH